MNLLAIDVGSSSVKAGLLRNGKVIRQARCEFPTLRQHQRAEVDSDCVLQAITLAIDVIGKSAADADLIALASMSPSWIAMGKKGNALTPIITHEDRRSLDIAVQIERRIGKLKHLKLTGVRPIPGGISSTTCAWFLKHQPALMRKADLVGHLPTFLHRKLTGERVVDPSHASFMGLFSTLMLRGWNDELCKAIGISESLLPEIKDADQMGGRLLPEAARRLGLREGTPMLAGMIDTGAAMLLAGAKPGTMVNVVGTTDVLALCTDHPKPHEKLLTRALGVGGRWVSVGTIAAAGSSLDWTRKQFFSELSEKEFFSLVKQAQEPGNVTFEPYLAGDRCAVEQRHATLSGLGLDSTRENVLAAVVDALARASAERIELLQATGTKINHQVMISGGGNGELARIMHRNWPGKWKFRVEEEATMRGLAKLAERAS